MRKILSAAMLFLVFGCVSQLQAQTTATPITLKTSNRMHYNEKENTVTLQGNASIATDKLTIDKAEKIVVEKGSNTITVYGPCDFTFSGKIVRMPTLGKQPKTLEYVVGADTVYLK